MKYWDKKLCSREAQAARRADTFARVREVLKDAFQPDENGNLIFRERRTELREAAYAAFAYLAGTSEDVRNGNRILRGLPIHHACHFRAAATVHMLCEYEDKLEPETTACLEKFIRGTFSDYMTRDMEFQGGNDNCPLGGLTVLVLGGERFGDESLVRFAAGRLRQCAEMLERHGYMHECVSPTYSGISLHYTAIAAEFARDPGCRELFLHIEQRIWRELLLHYHPGIGYWSGPYSRGYHDDCDAHLNDMTLLFHAALGLDTYLDLNKELFTPTGKIRCHNPWRQLQTSFSAHAAATYHIPEELADQALNHRKYPFTIRGTSKWMGSQYTPAHLSPVECFQQESYSVATFGARLDRGHAVPFHVLVKRTAEPSRPGDVRSIYSRMVVSQNFSSFMNPSQVISEQAEDYGAAFSVQKDSAVMLGYVPGPRRTPLNGIRTIHTSLYVPLFGSSPEELLFGNEPYACQTGSFQTVDWFFLREKDVFLAVRFLPVRTDALETCASRAQIRDQYLILSAYNRSAFHPKDYTEESIRELGGGFICEVGTKQEFGSFEAFRAAFSAVKIHDELWSGRRFMRYQRGSLKLELEYDFRYLQFTERCVNGRMIPQIPGIRTSQEMEKIPLQDAGDTEF